MSVRAGDPIAAAPQAEPYRGPNRSAALSCTKNGVVRPNIANAITILRFDEPWSGVLAYDELAEKIVALKAPPWHPHDAPLDVQPGFWTDEDTRRGQTSTDLASSWSESVVDRDSLLGRQAFAEGNLMRQVPTGECLFALADHGAVAFRTLILAHDLIWIDAFNMVM